MSFLVTNQHRPNGRSPAKGISSLSGAIVLSALLAGCAALPTASVNVDADRTITADVQSRLAQHGNLEQLNVQTVNGVVYLRGSVINELEREGAETTALATPHVARVVNTISIDNG